MSGKWSAVAVAFGAGVIGVATIAATEAYGKPKDLIMIRLAASRYNAGENGRAVLMPAGKKAEKTGVRIVVTGVPGYTSAPPHLYAYIFDGTCKSRSPAPRYSLTRKVLATTETGSTVGQLEIGEDVPVSFETLRSTPFAIVVRSSPADGNFELYCGDNNA